MKQETKPSPKHKAFFYEPKCGQCLSKYFCNNTELFANYTQNIFWNSRIKYVHANTDYWALYQATNETMKPTILKLFSLCILCNTNFKKPTQCTSQQSHFKVQSSNTAACFGVFVPSLGNSYIKFKTCWQCIIHQQFLNLMISQIGQNMQQRETILLNIHSFIH